MHPSESPSRPRPVQRTLFVPPCELGPEKLYYSVEGAVIAERERIVLRPHTRTTTNTYFGRFPASYWQRWTGVERVLVRADVAGEGKLLLKASERTGKNRTVDSVRVSPDLPTTTRVELGVDLNRFADGGALWLEAVTGAGSLAVGDVRWHVHGAPPRDHGVAVVICTYNRADDCLATLRALAADEECVAALDAVYVIDQGTDTVASREGFAELTEALNGKLRYLRQPNLGGAGGFTRGMCEASKMDGCPTHVVLMDDDIVLEPDTMLRLVQFANHTSAPAIVGGQMLKLLQPGHLHVAAEGVRWDRLRAGMPVPGSEQGADVTQWRQEVRLDAEYNAWWACLVPPEVVADIGYPLPFFFQWDDIEYGLRAKASGHPTVTLPGAGVWHADFEWKDWDDWPRYFSLRNSLIVSALHSEFDVRRTAGWLFTELLHYLVSMRYGLAATLIMAVEDFLAGPVLLADGGVEAMARVHKLRAEYPETEIHPAHGVSPVPVVIPAPEPSIPSLVLLKRLAWQLVGKSLGSAAIRAGDEHWWHVSLFQHAVVTDPSQAGVKIRRRDPAVLRGLAVRGIRTLARLVRDGHRVRRDYRAALPQLSGAENWARLFGAAD